MAAGAGTRGDATPIAVGERIRKTLEIADRWGYALSEEDLAHLLYGGPEDPATASGSLSSTPGIARRDGFVALAGREDLIDKSVGRARSNGRLARRYAEVAASFSADLLRHCPFVRAIALSGSAASRGIGDGDDVDFNVFAEDGTKYVVYLAGLLLGVKYSVRHWRGWGNGAFLGILPKVTCMNVVWTDRECRPFARRDEFLAFELLRSVPLAGSSHIRRVLAENPWLTDHFPQIYGDGMRDRIAPPAPSALARLLRWFAASPRRRRALDRACRTAARALHRVVDLSRERDPQATARAAFLRRVKHPYDVFQETP